MLSDSSVDYIRKICDLYGPPYDDRIKGKKHLSLRKFQHMLEEKEGIKLSLAKIQKILISGEKWSTKKTREVYQRFRKYTDKPGKGGLWMDSDDAVQRIAEELGVSISMVWNLLPYEKGVYDLEQRTENAVWCEKWRRQH